MTTVPLLTEPVASAASRLSPVGLALSGLVGSAQHDRGSWTACPVADYRDARDRRVCNGGVVRGGPDLAFAPALR